MVCSRQIGPYPCCTVVQGDCLRLLSAIPDGIVDAVVTDPPYSSGGQFRGDRANRSTSDKYVNSGTIAYRPEFAGDNRDQRSFLTWCNLWLSEARRASMVGALCVSFTDWRQLPTLTDAVQCAGWTWRGLGTWWKPGIRMMRGTFSGSAEYIVHGTNGPSESDYDGAQQNVFSCAPVGGDEKTHIAEKPEAVLEWILSVARPGGIVLDPFCGSGTTLIAAKRMGLHFLGMEISQEHVDTARGRLQLAESRPSLFEPKPEQMTLETA